MRFYHTSAKDFLRRRDMLKSHQLDAFAIDEQSTHAIIADVCLDCVEKTLSGQRGRQIQLEVKNRLKPLLRNNYDKSVAFDFLTKTPPIGQDTFPDPSNSIKGKLRIPIVDLAVKELELLHNALTEAPLFFYAAKWWVVHAAKAGLEVYYKVFNPDRLFFRHYA